MDSDDFFRLFVRDMEPTWFGYVCAIGFQLLLLAGSVFVAVHFIRKYW